MAIGDKYTLSSGEDPDVSLNRQVKLISKERHSGVYAVHLTFKNVKSTPVKFDYKEIVESKNAQFKIILKGSDDQRAQIQVTTNGVQIENKNNTTDHRGILFSFILGCYVYDAPSQSATHFREFLDGKLEEYGLQLYSSKFAVSDNDPKTLAAFRGDCTRIGCSDHYLNKHFQNAFESAEIHLTKNTIENVNCTAAQNIFLQVKSIVTDVRRSHRQQELSMKLH
ncbi:unnamed protein product, partial [Rotaria socialis]